MRALLKNFHDFISRVLFPLRAHEELIERATINELRTRMKIEEIICESVEVSALLPYRDPLVQACILEAKFHRNVRAYELLGGLLAEFLAKLAEKHPETGVVLIPIPLGAKRRAVRGYNQVEETARFILEKLGNPQYILAPHLLMRTRNTSPQMELGRAERLANMHGAFACTAAKLPPHLIYILLDDVLTTGATLSAAATALQTAGAHQISCISLAH